MLCVCVCGCSLRSESGFCYAAWVCGGGGRAQGRCAALPWDLHSGAAASFHWLPRSGGYESCVPQPAGCSARQLPQCCFAIWAGQADHFFFYLLPSIVSATVFWCISPSLCSGPLREESKPSYLAFTTSSAKHTPPLQVCNFFWFTFTLSHTVGCYSCGTSRKTGFPQFAVSYLVRILLVLIGKICTQWIYNFLFLYF